MNRLLTNFAGLSLRNPLIVSSSGLTNRADKNQRLEQAGAGAVVLKSVFEEQIMMETHHLATYGSPEESDYLNTYVRSHALTDYISLIEQTKKVCHIPVIASINCFSDAEWTSFAHTVAMAGADALEINLLSIQTAKEYAWGEWEQHHIDIVRHIKEQVSIPLIVKLGSNLTNPIALIQQLYANGANAVVLFNRFYQPDIDIDTLTYTSGEVFSSPANLSNSLRWTAIASAQVPQLDYAVSGGIHDGKAIIKSILAGASAVEVCSAIYQQGPTAIAAMTNEITQWVERKGYENLTQFKGAMNALSTHAGNPFERIQFMKYFSEKA